MRISSRIGITLASGILLVSLLMPLTAFALASSSSAATTNIAATSSAAQSNGSTGFVPLTKFPQIQSLADSSGFADFVNTLYKICIGLGASLAVIMIMVAGIQIMTSQGSVSSNEKAKNRIRNAVLGLVLVLAPTIVFGIINPSILNLNLGAEFGGLKQDTPLNQDAFSLASSTSNQPGYLLVYKFSATPKSGSGTTACSSIKAFYFATAADCQSYLNTNVTHGLQSSETDTYTYSVEKSCEYITDRSYTVPYDPKSCEVLQKNAQAQQGAQTGYIWSYAILNGSPVGDISTTQSGCQASQAQWDKNNPGIKQNRVTSTICNCSKVQTRASCQI